MRRTTPIALALLLGGCIGLTDFDPVGTDATIKGGWTIDGAAPTEASCEALGADRVRVSFLDDRRPVPHGGLYFECFGDHLGAFDTAAMGGSGPVVGEGRWMIRLDAIDASLVQASGPTLSVTVPEDSDAITEIDLGTADFLTGIVSARYEVGGQTASNTSCDDAGIAEVEIAFVDVGTGRIAADANEPCAAGAVGTRVMPGATYMVRLRTIDPSGAIIGESAVESVASVSGEDNVLNGGSDFELTAL